LGGTEKTPWLVHVAKAHGLRTGTEEAAMTSSGTVQGITGQRAEAVIGERDVGIWARRVED
jgi:hypothetical protein